MMNNSNSSRYIESENQISTRFKVIHSSNFLNKTFQSSGSQVSGHGESFNKDQIVTPTGDTDRVVTNIQIENKPLNMT